MSSSTSILEKRGKNRNKNTATAILPHEYLLKNLYNHQQYAKKPHNKK